MTSINEAAEAYKAATNFANLEECILYFITGDCCTPDGTAIQGQSLSFTNTMVRDFYKVGANLANFESLLEELGFSVVPGRCANAHSNGYGKLCRIVTI